MQLLTDRQVAEQLNCGKSTVWRHVKNGILPIPIKIGHLTRWRAEDVSAFINSLARNVKGEEV